MPLGPRWGLVLRNDGECGLPINKTEERSHAPITHDARASSTREHSSVLPPHGDAARGLSRKIPGNVTYSPTPARAEGVGSGAVKGGVGWRTRVRAGDDRKIEGAVEGRGLRWQPRTRQETQRAAPAPRAVLARARSLRHDSEAFGDASSTRKLRSDCCAREDLQALLRAGACERQPCGREETTWERASSRL